MRTFQKLHFDFIYCKLLELVRCSASFKFQLLSKSNKFLPEKRANQTDQTVVKLEISGDVEAET